MSATAALQLTDTQAEFARAVLSLKYRYLLFGGAIRGGKSYGAFAVLIALAKIFKGSRWAIVRKDLPSIKRTVIKTFDKVKFEPFVGQLNQSTWTYTCQNGSEILLFPESLKGDPEHERWRGLEVNGFVLEECNELQEASFIKAIERAGSWTAESETQPPPLILMTCNPSWNWVKTLFYDKWKSGTLEAPYFYFPSKITDNPHLDVEYLKSLETTKELDPKFYKRFIEGDWSVEDDPEQLITAEFLATAATAEFVPGNNTLGVDVARFGPDKTTLAHYEGNRLWRIDCHSGLRTTETARKVQAFINTTPVAPENVFVDTVGLGGGVADTLHESGFEVIEVISGANPVERETKTHSKFKNLRSQLWWEYKEALRKGEIVFSIDDPQKLALLKADLMAPRYSTSGDKVITVEPKDITKKRLGRSPDYGDAAIYGRANLRPPKPRAFCVY